MKNLLKHLTGELNKIADKELKQEKGNPYTLIQCPKCKGKIARKYFDVHYCPKKS